MYYDSVNSDFYFLNVYNAVVAVNLISRQKPSMILTISPVMG
jgi:hypothetical protein